MSDKYVMQEGGSSQHPQGYYPLQPQPVMPYPSSAGPSGAAASPVASPPPIQAPMPPPEPMAQQFQQQLQQLQQQFSAQPQQYGAQPQLFGSQPQQFGGQPQQQFGNPQQQFGNQQQQFGNQQQQQFGGQSPSGGGGLLSMPPSFMQPGGPLLKPVVWMQKPMGTIPSCPPGLEYLTQIDQLLVHQQVELMEVFTNWETSNRYQVKNSLGQQIYFAAEESDSCMRQCCGPQRNFVMHVSDNLGQEVIRVVRDFKCCGGCCQCLAGIPSCADEVVVEAPPGVTAGCVIQSPSCCQPSYEIRDHADQVVLHINGPMCVCEGPFCTGEQEFQVLSADKTQEVGKICKQWSGFMREYFTDADNFGVNFPLDLDVRLKATMIGAVFLIDFAFFEDNQQSTSRS